TSRTRCRRAARGSWRCSRSAGSPMSRRRSRRPTRSASTRSTPQARTTSSRQPPRRRDDGLASSSRRDGTWGMGEAIGQLLPFAVGVAVSPMPIVAVVLMLVTPQARSNGPAFLLGWIAGVGVGGAILLAIAGPANANDNGAPADWTYWLKLLLGLALLL